MASRSDPLYAGTPLTLTCTTTLDDSVDDGEVVNTVWTGPTWYNTVQWKSTDHH